MRRYSAFSPEMGLPDVLPGPRGTPPNPMQWGTTRVIESAEWAENVPLALTTIDKHTIQHRVPYTQSIVLTCEFGGSELNRNFVLYWLLEVGAGGGRTVFQMDAGGTQQVTVPAETVRISIVARNPMQIVSSPDLADPFIAPLNQVKASVFMADGTTATDSPTMTQEFDIEAANIVIARPPIGANGFRICGETGAAGPFTSDTVYFSQSADGAIIDTFAGDFLEGIRYATMPFNGQAVDLYIDNSANLAEILGWVEWSLDL